jgi:hypothetical protein
MSDYQSNSNLHAENLSVNNRDVKNWLADANGRFHPLFGRDYTAQFHIVI